MHIEADQHLKMYDSEQHIQCLCCRWTGVCPNTNKGSREAQTEAVAEVKLHGFC